MESVRDCCHSSSAPAGSQTGLQQATGAGRYSEAMKLAGEDRDRTSDNWRAHCQRILQELHPDYRAAGPFSGRRIEIRRALESGLIISHSYFVHRARDYHQSFAVMWSTGNERSPYSLLRAGTRFFDRPLGEVLGMDGIPRPPGLRDVQTWRSNSIPFLSRSLAVAEEEVLPRYLAIVKRGAARLARFFRTAGDMIEGLPRRLPRSVEDRARLLGVDPDRIEPHRSAAWVVTATDILMNREPYTEIPTGPRHAAIVLGRLDDLLHVAHEIPAIVRTLGAA